MIYEDGVIFVGSTVEINTYRFIPSEETVEEWWILGVQGNVTVDNISQIRKIRLLNRHKNTSF